jgi:hypothetical protein
MIIVVGSQDCELVTVPRSGMLVTPVWSPVDVGDGVEVGVEGGGVDGGALLVVLSAGFDEERRVLEGGGGGGVELGGGTVVSLGVGGGVLTGGGSVVLVLIGGSTGGVDDDGGGGTTLLSGGMPVPLGSGVSVITEGTIPVPGVWAGRSDGMVTTEVGSGMISVAFWSGGRTLVITEAMLLTTDSIGLGGFEDTAGAGVISVELTMPVGAITIPASLVGVGVGITDTTGSLVAGLSMVAVEFPLSSSETGNCDVGSAVGRDTGTDSLSGGVSEALSDGDVFGSSTVGVALTVSLDGSAEVSLLRIVEGAVSPGET